MKHNKIGTYTALILGMTFLLSGCGSKNQQVATTGETSSTDYTMVESTTTKKEDGSMQIQLNGKIYSVALDDNETVRDLASHMPLDLSMVRYAGHEYYAELPFTPVFDETRTSEIKAGHVYYWDGWNAFVINYVDYDISPYKVVHIGEITDQSVVDVLMNADEQVTIQVTK